MTLTPDTSRPIKPKNFWLNYMWCCTFKCPSTPLDIHSKKKKGLVIYTFLSEMQIIKCVKCLANFSLMLLSGVAHFPLYCRTSTVNWCKPLLHAGGRLTCWHLQSWFWGWSWKMLRLIVVGNYMTVLLSWSKLKLKITIYYRSMLICFASLWK